MKTDSVIKESTLPETREYFSVAAVKTEEVSVYVIGGILNNSVTTNSVLLWDPKTLKWNPVASMETKRAQFGTAVINNKFYVVGGKNEENQPLNTMEVYDPVENIWSQCPPMLCERISPGVSDIYRIKQNNKNSDITHFIRSVPLMGICMFSGEWAKMKNSSQQSNDTIL